MITFVVLITYGGVRGLATRNVLGKEEGEGLYYHHQLDQIRQHS